MFMYFSLASVSTCSTSAHLSLVEPAGLNSPLLEHSKKQ
uniref:Uncharacterized protein n=1 Tax=Moniliophthora roreri TaxID=221103 RepID=A0A0W0GCV1_MONRR